jgi:hypothetical protein
VDEIPLRVWHDLADRVHGPMTFRLILQPLMATFFALRAGWRDGRQGKHLLLRGIVMRVVRWSYHGRPPPRPSLS